MSDADLQIRPPEAPEKRPVAAVLYGVIAFVMITVVFGVLMILEGPQRTPIDSKTPSHINRSRDAMEHAPAEPEDIPAGPSAGTIHNQTAQAAAKWAPAGVAKPAGQPMPSTGKPAGKSSLQPKPDSKIAVTPRPSPGRFADGVPRLAIVIDDWGYASTAAPRFLHMGIPLTAAVIPYLPASRKYANEAAAAGYDVLLHLPMEPEDVSLRTAGMVTVDMSEQKIVETVEAALATLPVVIGMNNHMGSKATADPRVMQAVLSVIKRKGMFYLDSRTSAASVGAATAGSIGLPVLENSKFIDDKADRTYIKNELLKAARIAKSRGTAIAIGHVRPATADGIEAALPEIAQLGVRLVRISEFVSERTQSAPPMVAPTSQPTRAKSTTPKSSVGPAEVSTPANALPPAALPNQVNAPSAAGSHAPANDAASGVDQAPAGVSTPNVLPQPVHTAPAPSIGASDQETPEAAEPAALPQ